MPDYSIVFFATRCGFGEQIGQASVRLPDELPRGLRLQYVQLGIFRGLDGHIRYSAPTVPGRYLASRHSLFTFDDEASAEEFLAQVDRAMRRDYPNLFLGEAAP